MAAKVAEAKAASRKAVLDISLSHWLMFAVSFVKILKVILRVQFLSSLQEAGIITIPTVAALLYSSENMSILVLF